MAGPSAQGRGGGGPGACDACGAALELPLACAACGAVQEPARELGPFEVFGLTPAWAVDRGELRKRLLAASRRVHPDYFGTDPDARRRAEAATALLNGAYAVLEDDYRRADWLQRSLGGPDENAERQMPQEFLMEVLEWNEALEEARDAPAGSPARAALDRLRPALVERRAQTVASLGELLDPLPERGAPALVGVRQGLNAIRYLNRTLGELEALRLEQASTPR